MLLVSNGYKGRVLIRYASASIWDARPFFTDRTGHRVGGQAILSLFTHTDTAWQYGRPLCPSPKMLIMAPRSCFFPGIRPSSRAFPPEIRRETTIL
jgi:hypothetical protein